MTSLLRVLGFLGAAMLAASAAHALDGAQFAVNDPAHARRRAAAPAAEAARGDNAMQAVCREILVDTDEGYGVTNHEARVICDEMP